MTTFLRQGTATTVKLGEFVDATDGATPESALTIQKADVLLSKNGGAFAAASADQGAANAGAAYDAAAAYDISLDTTDTGTVGPLKISVLKSGALPVSQTFFVMPAVAYDYLFGTSPFSISYAGTAQSAGAQQLELAAADAGFPGDIIEIVSATTGAGQQNVLESLVSGDNWNLANAWDTTPTGTITYRRYPGTAGLTTTDIVTAIFARAFDATKMSGLTFAQLIGIIASVLAGAVTGLPNAPVIKNIGGTVTAVSGTTDSNGNRSGLTVDGSAIE